MLSLRVFRCVKNIKNRTLQTSSVLRKCLSTQSNSPRHVETKVRLCTLKSKYNVEGSVRHIYSAVILNNDHEEFDKEEEEEVETKSKKGKLFSQVENDFNHSVLERNPAYSNTVLKFDKEEFKKNYATSEEEFNNIVSRIDWASVTPDETFISFVKAGVYAAERLHVPLSDSRFKHLSEGFVTKCKHLTDDQLIESLLALSVWPPSESVLEENFLKVWKAIDATLLEKYYDWDINKRLYVIDVWYNLKLTRLSEFVFLVTMRLSRKILKFSPPQLIQSLFYMNTARKISPATSMFEFEYMLEQHLDKLSVEEIGVAATGFFKSKSRIKSLSLLMAIMNRVIENIDNIPDITLAAILKVIRYSPKAPLATKIEQLLDILAARMDSRGFLSNIHVLLMANSLNIFHENAITKVVNQFLQNPSAVRLKDIEKLVQTLSRYNFIPASSPDILSVIVREVQSPEREREHEFYPKCLAWIAYYLSLMKVYPVDLIREVLSPEWIHKTYGKHKYVTERCIAMLDYNVQLECDEKNLSTVPADDLEYYCKRYSKFIPGQSRGKMSPFDKFLNEVLIIAEKILGGKEMFLCHYFLPHHSAADIAFLLSKTNRPLPIPEDMKSIPYFKGVVKPTKPGNWRCLVAAARNMYIINRPGLLNEYNAKIRQLKLLGYEPVVVSLADWYNLQPEQKESFIRDKIFKGNTSAEVNLEQASKV